MQINEINWLHNKKESLLKQLIDLQEKSHGKFMEHEQAKNKVQKELKQKEDELQQAKRNWENEMSQMERKIEKLEELVVKNDKNIQKLEADKEELQKKNSNLDGQVKKLASNLQSREQQLQTLKQQTQTKLTQQQLQFTRSLDKQQQKVTQIVSKYQSLLKEKQQFYRQKFDKDLLEIRRENDAMIKKLQERCSVKEVGDKEEERKFQKQCIRLVEDNKRVLVELSGCKVKLLAAESALSQERQHNKLKHKEYELKLEHSRKELELIKQAESRLITKNKAYIEQNQELLWQIKELQLTMGEQVKKVRKIAQRELAEIIEKSQKEVQSMKAQLNLVKNNELSPLLQQNTTIKRSMDLLHKQKLQLQKQCQSHQLQVKNLNQEFSSILKTTKQNQTLKQNNLKKCQQIQVLQEEIKRLKQKCNKLSTVYQQTLKHKQIMEQENKMLLEEIIFLREKQHKTRKNNDRNDTSFSQRNHQNLQTQPRQQTQNRQQTIIDQTSHVLSMKSELSQDYEDVNEYKEVIKELDKGMQDALAKINQKQKLIEKQQSMIAKMERIIAYGK